jgi:hypothetical protein
MLQAKLKDAGWRIELRAETRGFGKPVCRSLSFEAFRQHFEGEGFYGIRLLVARDLVLDALKK